MSCFWAQVVTLPTLNGYAYILIFVDQMFVTPAQWTKFLYMDSTLPFQTIKNIDGFE